MKKKTTVAITLAILLCLALVLIFTLKGASSATPPVAEYTAPPETQAPEDDANAAEPVYDSVLYYGQIEQITTGEDGSVSQLLLSSERYGEYIMHLYDGSFWIDGGKRCSADPASLQTGDSLYIFHSPVSTASLPPQSQAFALISNMPQDMRCPMYYEVEAITEKDGSFEITADNGNTLINTDSNTEIISFSDGSAAEADSLNKAAHIMVWYASSGNDDNAQTVASCIMILD